MATDDKIEYGLSITSISRIFLSFHESELGLYALYNYDLPEDNPILNKTIEGVNRFYSTAAKIFDENGFALSFNGKFRKAAFTGHRPQSFTFKYNEQDSRCRRIKEEIWSYLLYMVYYEHYNYFICGGAEGADMWFAEAVMGFKRIFPTIKLEMAIPFEGHDKNWSTKQRNRLKHIISQADTVNYLSENGKVKDVYHIRNRYMVDQVEAILAVTKDKPSGTAKTLRYAEEKNLSIFRIHAQDFDLQW